MGDEAQGCCCGCIHEVASEDSEARCLYPADPCGTLGASETRVDAIEVSGNLSIVFSVPTL